MKLTTIDLTPYIGIEIKADLVTLLNGSVAAEFPCLLDERGVIALREVNLDDRQQVAFAKTLGEITRLGDDSIFKVTLDKKQNRAAEYPKAAFSWHSDGTTGEIPNRAVHP
jgi:hypothetical protein